MLPEIRHPPRADMPVPKPLNAEVERQAEAEEKKVVTLSSKVLYNVNFEFTDLDKEVAIEKMTAAATKVPFLPPLPRITRYLSY